MTSILQLVEALVRDPGAKSAYAADPGGYLDQQGFGDLDADDLHEALAQAADSFPPPLAARMDPGAGLAPLVQVDLGELGLDDVDDFSADSRLDDVDPLPSADGFATGADTGIEEGVDLGFDVDLDRAELAADPGGDEDETAGRPVVDILPEPATAGSADEGDEPSDGFSAVDSLWDEPFDDPSASSALAGVGVVPSLAQAGASDDDPWYARPAGDHDPFLLGHDAQVDHDGDLEDS